MIFAALKAALAARYAVPTTPAAPRTVKISGELLLINFPMLDTDGCMFTYVSLRLVLLAHLSYENPKQPQSSCDCDHEKIEEEISNLVLRVKADALYVHGNPFDYVAKNMMRGLGFAA